MLFVKKGVVGHVSFTQVIVPYFLDFFGDRLYAFWISFISPASHEMLGNTCHCPGSCAIYFLFPNTIEL